MTGIWAGTVRIQPATRTGPHHHGDLESVIYVLMRRALTRWGDRLEFASEAGTRDFICVPRTCPARKSTPARTSR
jgi:uncharacterized RmlC-like cupin family protein